MAQKKLSFKEGSVARKARSAMAETMKERGGAREPFAVATAAVKRMSPAKRKSVAARR